MDHRQDMWHQRHSLQVLFGMFSRTNKTYTKCMQRLCFCYFWALTGSWWCCRIIKPGFWLQAWMEDAYCWVVEGVQLVKDFLGIVHFIMPYWMMMIIVIWAKWYRNVCFYIRIVEDTIVFAVDVCVESCTLIQVPMSYWLIFDKEIRKTLWSHSMCGMPYFCIVLEITITKNSQLLTYIPPSR